ncbi:MAG: ISL3 family transposase [Actinomycetota bacterium]|nr:ISL3 family transposase [Actinomycetota bacterium]
MQEQAINAALDLCGLEVRAVSVEADLIEVVVESRLEAGSCTTCGGIAAEAKERPQVWVRDLAISGRPVMLRWIKRRWRCRYCRATWTEAHPQIPPRSRMTLRFRSHLATRAIAERNFSQVAAAEGVSYDTVARAHRARARLVDHNRPRPAPRILGVDEAALRKGHSYSTVISDPERRYVIDTLPGRHAAPLQAWLQRLDPEVKEGIEAVVIDLFQPFHFAVMAALPHAARVADKFHVLRNVNHALDRQRSRIQGRGHKIGARRRLFRSRFLFLRAGDELNGAQRHRLEAIFFDHPELAIGWHLKEDFRAIYELCDGDAQRGREMLQWWLDRAARSAIPEFERLAANLRPWLEELVAYFVFRATNGFAEGITNRIKVIKRQAYGLPNFESFRRRILVECGTPRLGVPA